MKNTTFRMIGALISLHILEAYIVGRNLQPFEFSMSYLWGLIPVILALFAAFWGLDSAFQRYEYDSLKGKILKTVKTPWAWVLFFITILLVVGIMWHGVQMLKPTEEIYSSIIFNGDARIGNIICWGVCMLFYVISIIGLHKTLK